jgi:4-hydroxythreonine-4-phosphate dehydrogenase
MLQDRTADRPLALTMGDPAGIGLEIAIRAFLRRAAGGVPPFALYADPASVEKRAHALGTPITVEPVAGPEGAAARFAEALPIVAIPLAEPAVPGRPSPANAAATVAAIDRATADVIAGRAAALVTNPIAKSVLYGAGFRHPGHTEYLAHLAARLGGGPEPEPVMMLSGGGLNVVPLTIHVPLADVPRLVTFDLIVRTVRTVAAALRRDMGLEQPRVAVAGLNPHAGESGTIGREDAEVVAPAVASLAAEGLRVTGPLPADTMFHAPARARYDVAVAMYHDQALIPVKTLAFDTGVNSTLGLPFVRTSPDHGTAFDIAARACASPESLVAALQMAARMATARRRERA